jgi:hypothetical protein
VDAERTALARYVIEEVGVLGMVGQHQGELVGDDEQRRQRRQIVARRDGSLVFDYRVEGAALYPPARFHQQLFASRHFTAQRVGETVCKRTLLGHVRDDGDDLREVTEDVGSSFTLEVGVDDDQPIGRVSSQQRQQDRHQRLRLARAGHADHQAVRAHTALRLVLQVEHQRFAGGRHADGHPQLVGSRTRRP